jgi:hypothetical protein
MALIFDEIQGKVLKIGRDNDNLIDFSTDNQIRFRVNGGDEANMTNAFFYPHSNDGMALGIGTNAWSDLFLASGAVINFNNGDVTLTHSSNTLTINDNLTVGGDLTIVGSTIMQSTTNTTISDTIIRLNDGVSGSANTSDTGLMFNRGTSDRVFFGWDESADKFIMVTTSTAADNV